MINPFIMPLNPPLKPGEFKASQLMATVDSNLSFQTTVTYTIVKSVAGLVNSPRGLALTGNVQEIFLIPLGTL